MIKLFRKIRQKLLRENRFSKYLFYAVGEIFLVVLGILIAFQINKWNESRMEKKLEKELLKEVKLGLEYDLKEMIIVINNNRSYLNSQEIIVNWLESNLPYNDSLSMHFLRTTYCTNLLSKDGPFETLKQIGMRTIRDEELRDQISTLYDLDYQELYWWQSEYEQAKVHFRNAFDQHFIVRTNKSQQQRSIEPWDINALKTDNSFLFNLQLVRGMFNHYTNFILVNTKVEIEKTIDLIEDVFEFNERE